MNDKWEIPKKYLPTEKQEKTILFINNHLKMDLKALTKHQCWLDIGNILKKQRKHHYIQVSIMKTYKSILDFVKEIFVDMEFTIKVEPFSWNDNFSKVALEDFSMVQKKLPYGICQSIGMALAKLELLEKQGCKVEEIEDDI